MELRSNRKWGTRLPAWQARLRQGSTAWQAGMSPLRFKSVPIREIRGFFLSSLSVSSVISVVFLLSPFVNNRT